MVGGGVIASGKGLGLGPVRWEVSGSNPPLVGKQRQRLGFPLSLKILSMPLHCVPHIFHKKNDLYTSHWTQRSPQICTWCIIISMHHIANKVKVLQTEIAGAKWGKPMQNVMWLYATKWSLSRLIAQGRR